MKYPEWIDKIFPQARGAFDTFKNHELQEIEVYNPITKRGEYRWGRPDSRMYEMYIILRPSTIITYGDLGTWVFRQDSIGLSWLRGSIDSPDYMFSKTSRDHQPKYDDEETKNWAQECINELLEDPPDNIDEIKKEFECVDWSNPQFAYDFFNDVLEYDCAYEDVIIETWRAAGATWPWVALKTFLHTLDDISSFYCCDCKKWVNKTVVGFNEIHGGYYCNSCKEKKQKTEDVPDE